MSISRSQLQANRFLNFTGNIGDLVHNEIREVDASSTIHRASNLMMDPQINYLIVTENDIPIGMLSKAELLAHSMTSDEQRNTSVKKIMNADLVSVQQSDSVMETLMFMLKHDLHHLLVLNGNKPLGVITQKDWLQVEVSYPVQMLKEIQNASSVDMLAKIRKEAKEVVWDNFVKEGNAISLTNVVTMINDSITKRIIQLSLEGMQATGYGIPPVSFVWIGMGSEGRMSQTIRTNQDNGLIFEDVPQEKYEEIKKWFLLLAEKITKSLAICGFPLCNGNVMATNPDLCNSVSKWNDHFERIITNADSKELLEASIYFDFRAIYGNKELSKELWEKLFNLIEKYPNFLRLFADNILEASRPPIKKLKWQLHGVFKTVPPPFDIKREASAPLDAAIRLLALYCRVNATSTLERLKLILEKGQISKSLADEIKIAFDFILRLRFRLEFNIDDDKKSVHQVEVQKLIPLQVRKLKESLKTVYELQDYVFTHITGRNVPWAFR